MFFKVCCLLIAVPSTVVGGYFLTKNFNNEKIFGGVGEKYLIVKVQKPKSFISKNIAKQTDKIYDNKKKNFRCVINDDPAQAVYDNSCEIYKLDNTNGTTGPKIIGKEEINKIDLDKPSEITISDIKQNNLYLLKVDGYIFNNIDNSTRIQLVDMGSFPQQKEFVNLKVEAVLSGGGKKPKIHGGDKILLNFDAKFKTNLLLVKLTTDASSFSWDNNLKCAVKDNIQSCDAWQLSNKPDKNSKINALTISSFTKASSTNNLTKDEYYILDINTNNVEFSDKDTIMFSNNSGTPASTNSFTVIAGVLGTLDEKTNKFSNSDQVVFISQSGNVTI